MKKLIVINCDNSSENDIKNIQTFLFDNGYYWNSSKYNDERKYKNNINLIILEGNNIFNAHEKILRGLADFNMFNNPVEYMRYFKINKIKQNV